MTGLSLPTTPGKRELEDGDGAPTQILSYDEARENRTYHKRNILITRAYCLANTIINC